MRLLNAVKNKHLDRWLPGYLKHVARSLTRRTRPRGPRHLLFAVCDHYEPLWEDPDDATAVKRVETWHTGYPAMGTQYTDADGRHPQHSFFFPGEEYRPEFFDLIDDLVRQRFGEVELHLHHEDSTADELRAEILKYLELFAARGHFSRDDDKIRYAFIHGNWALANGHPEGLHCGVDEELPLLFDTGCYADFTFPSVPDPSQPNIVNQIYWPTGALHERRSYEVGTEASVGKKHDDRILMITGPLALARRGRGVRIEYGALTAHDPPNADRVKTWVDQNIHVAGRPEWVFVKLYTHGAQEPQADALLGDGGHMMHRALQAYNDGTEWKLHYVTAREMFNIAHAAMAGREGDPNDYRDFVLAPPPILTDAEQGELKER